MPFLHAPRAQDARKRLIGDDDIGEGLIVAQQRVIFGLVILDELVLGDEGFDLTADREVFEVVDLRHHGADFGREITRGTEIARDAAAQGGRLAHVQDVAVLVLEDIAARPGRQALQPFLNARVCHRCQCS